MASVCLLVGLYFEIKGTAPRTPTTKFACYVLYLKIINTFLKYNMHLIVNCPRKSKNGIEILVRQMVFKLWIKHSKCCLDQ